MYNIFSLYVLRKFFKGFVLIFIALSLIIILSNFMELVKLSYGKNLSFSLLGKLTLLKYPYTINKTTAFMVFLSCMYCLSQLTKSSELIVARSFGISIWQILLPLICGALLLGAIFVAAINPIASFLLAKQEKILHKYIKNAENIITVYHHGIWLKEKSAKESIIIHADYAYGKDVILHGVDFFILNQENHFIKRLKANSAKLTNNYWTLNKVNVLTKDDAAVFYPSYKIPTTLVITRLQDNFASPETISFWQLPEFIKTIKASGFPANKHTLYYYSLVIYPFFLCAMVLISARFSLTNPRNSNSSLMIIGGVIFGFIIYFFNSYVITLSSSGRMPIIIAAVSPTIIAMLIGILLVLYSDDG
jgi:lipopolysaccharide export system permease protein